MAPQKVSAIRRYDFKGGVDLRVTPSLVPEDQLADVRNWTLDESGKLTRRKGSEVWASGGGSFPCSGAHRFYRSGGSRHALAVFGTTVYSVNEEEGSLSPIATGWASQNPTFFITWKDLAFMFNGVDTPRYWDGVASSASELANAPNGGFAAVHNGRLMVAQGSNLHWSALEDYTGWAEGGNEDSGFLPVYDNDGQKITGLAPHTGGLLILKEASLCYLYGYGPDEWIVRKEYERIGCIAPGTVSSGLGRTFFLGADGLYMEVGQDIFTISKPVEPLLERLTLDERRQAWGIYHDGVYYLSIRAQSGDPGNSLLLGYRVEESERLGHPVWEIHSGIGGNAMISLFRAGDTGDLIVGSSAPDGTLRRVFAGASDEGRDIEAYATTGRLLGDQYDMWLAFQEMWVDADFPEGGELILEWRTFQNGGKEVIGTKTLTKAGRVSLPATCQGRDLQLTFRVNDALDGWKLRGYTVAPRFVRVNRP